MSTIGAQLTSLRKARNMTMETLARSAGVSRMTVQRIEAGGDVRLQTLEDILRALGIELMVAPLALRQELEQFVQAQGRVIGQPAGVGAPPSIVDQIRMGQG